MPTLAYFGINSGGLNLALSLLFLFLGVLYCSLIYWTYTDARRRIVDPMLIACATAASLFPYVGTIIYIILRPPEYLEDVRERELEMQAAEVRLQQLDQQLCPHCDHAIERDFLRCPSCLRKLKEPCTTCKRPLERTWSICPYCEAEVVGVASPKRSRARRERGGSNAADSESAAAATTAMTAPRAKAAPAVPGRARMAIESEAQTDEGDALLGEETLAGKPSVASSRGAPRAARPRTDV